VNRDAVDLEAEPNFGELAEYWEFSLLSDGIAKGDKCSSVDVAKRLK